MFELWYVKVVRACVCGEEGAEEKRSGGCVSSVKVDLRFIHFSSVTVGSNPMGISELKTFFFPLTAGGLLVPPLWQQLWQQLWHS